MSVSSIQRLRLFPFLTIIPPFDPVRETFANLQSGFIILQDSCGAVQIENEAIQLASCSDLSSDLGTDLKFQYTVVDDGNGNSTLRGVIDAAATPGSIDWAAVGFQQELEMIGGSAIVVQTCSSCASGIHSLASIHTQVSICLLKLVGEIAEDSAAERTHLVTHYVSCLFAGDDCDELALLASLASLCKPKSMKASSSLSNVCRSLCE